MMEAQEGEFDVQNLCKEEEKKWLHKDACPLTSADAPWQPYRHTQSDADTQ